MSIDSLKSLLSDFDPASFLPKLDTLLGQIELNLRIAEMIGPLVLMVLGLLYLFASPKEANHHFGYRCYFGMGSMEAWAFSQKLAGIVWGALGLLLTIIMALIVNRYRTMEAEAMLWFAVKCILWEVGLTAVSTIGINVTVMWFFDRDGNRRRDGKAAGQDETPDDEA